MILCPQCRRLSDTSPCPSCKRRANRRRGTPASRGYGPDWQVLSRRARRLQPWCTFCGATDDLTVDHVVPLAQTGTQVRPTLADVQVLCRSCNSTKGASRDGGPTELLAPPLPGGPAVPRRAPPQGGPADHDEREDDA